MIVRLLAEHTVDAFREFFQVTMGYQPFEWQERLATWLVEGRIPTVLDVATGLGKTALLHAWVFALAAQLERDGGRRNLPLRLMYVVDRRIVVDAVFETACRLGEVLQRGSIDKPVVQRVAGALRTVAGNDGKPLAVTRMRGGTTWDARWLDSPTQPAIVVGTADQIGSRLLFRGYGASPSMAPIDAALCGLDSWIVVDEAHIAQPLVEAVKRVTSLQEAERRLSLHPSVVTVMSATPGDGDAYQGEGLVAEVDQEVDRPDAPTAAATARRRLQIPKPAWLTEVRIGEDADTRLSRLGKELVRLLNQSFDPLPQRIAIICNTVQAARAAFESLEGDHFDRFLLTGRVREFEREELAASVVQRFGSNSPRTPRPAVLVATQTIEVGADLDFDAIITECAPLSSLIQRFGRVKRMGNSYDERPSIIVYARGLHDDDPVYGEATKVTWEGLLRIAKGEPPCVDFCIERVAEIRGATSDGCEPKSPVTPVLLGAHVERWAQTAPRPHADQPVDPFIHGFSDRSAPRAYVVWRAVPAPAKDVDEQQHWTRWLELARVTDWERVEVPLHELRAFLAGREPRGATSDVESLEGAEDTEAGSAQSSDSRLSLAVLLSSDGDSPRPLRDPSDVKPFDTVVLSSFLGGHDRWGWNPKELPGAAVAVPDVADFVPSRRRRSVRLAPSVATSFAPDRAEELLQTWTTLSIESPESTAADVLDRFAELIPEPLSGLYREAAKGLRDGSWAVYPPEQDDSGNWVLTDEGRPVLRIVERHDAPRVAAAEQSDEDPLSSSFTGGVQVSLKDHGEAAAQLARTFAERLGLAGPIVKAVELAARLHDLGKAEPRFQVLLYDGDALAARAGELLAKSGRDPRDAVARQAWRIAGLPHGFRHEAVSARMCREVARLRPEQFSDCDIDLVHHLIVSHHGYARPLLPAIEDLDAEEFEVDVDGIVLQVSPARRQIDWDHPARFERLCSKYGWWGLALLESIVRLADMKVSEL